MVAFIIFFIVLPSIVCLIIVFAKRSNSLKPLIIQNQGSININGEGILNVEGREVFVKYTPGSSNRSPEFKMYANGEFGTDLLIRYETSGDKFYKSVGLNREVQVPDREVNDQLYFECDDQDFVNRLFLNSKTKVDVFDLLKNYTDIEITTKRCLLKKYPAPPLSSITQEVLMASAKEVLDLASLIPNKAGEHPEIITFKLRRAIVQVLGTIILVMGIFFWIWANVQFRVVDAMALWICSTNFTIPLALAVSALVFFIIKGFSTSSHVLTYFVITFSIGIILTGRYGAAVYNGIYDKERPSVFNQPVVDKYTTTHKSSTTYHVVVEKWRENMSNWHFTVSSSLYYQIHVHSTKYQIMTKPGRLGYEWVVFERMLSSEEAQAVQISPDYWPQKYYNTWYPLPSDVSGVDPMEMAYWKQWCNLIQEGITNRMNMHDALNLPRSKEFYASIQEKYRSLQQSVLQRLSSLDPPERLKAFQDAVVWAGFDQMDFYNDYVQSKMLNPNGPFSADNDHLKASDKKLWDAYHLFQSLYPSRTKAFNDAIERRLAWFDII